METAELHWIDLTVIIVYMVGMLGMGVWFMRRQKSTSEYLLASRTVGWVAIGLSLLSSLNSASDYVVTPSAYMQYGLLLCVGFPSLILGFVFSLIFFIPFYQRLHVYNCYEYLELRFGPGVRATSSVIFIIWRICWMGFTLYLPAFVLNRVMGFPLVKTVIVLGIITTTYTTLGGVRAVIWTDVTQAVIMFVGLVLSLFLLFFAIPGGWDEVWQTAQNTNFLEYKAHIEGWETAGLWRRIDLYFHHNMTFWSVTVSIFIAVLTNYGADHVMVQRYLSARSLEDCKKGFKTNVVAYIVYIIMFILLGLLLLTYFTRNPLPAGTNTDDCFPYFIAFKMPVVITGLIIAAIYSAAQSSVSAGISASTSVIYSNLYIRLFKGQVAVDEDMGEEIQQRHVLFSRLCALALGVCVTVLAIAIPHIGMDLFRLFNKIVGNFAGVMIPVFLLGMFSRRVNGVGTAIGAVCGLVAMFVWGFGHQWGVFKEEMGYGWTGVVGFSVTIVVAYLFSLFEEPPTPDKLQYLWKNVKERDETAAK